MKRPNSFWTEDAPWLAGIIAAFVVISCGVEKGTEPGSTPLIEAKREPSVTDLQRHEYIWDLGSPRTFVIDGHQCIALQYDRGVGLSCDWNHYVGQPTCTTDSDCEEKYGVEEVK